MFHVPRDTNDSSSTTLTNMYCRQYYSLVFSSQQKCECTRARVQWSLHDLKSAGLTSATWQCIVQIENMVVPLELHRVPNHEIGLVAIHVGRFHTCDAPKQGPVSCACDGRVLSDMISSLWCAASDHGDMVVSNRQGVSPSAGLHPAMLPGIIPSTKKIQGCQTTAHDVRNRTLQLHCINQYIINGILEELVGSGIS